MSDEKVESVLENVDPERRSALRAMIVRTAFVAPVVASFAMSGLSINEAHAYVSNIRVPT